jgi:tetratricopeptide (TPR) repeat protein
MKKNYFFLILISSFYYSSFAQTPLIDSLKIALKAAKDDTTVIKTTNYLSWELLNTGDYDIAMQLSNDALKSSFDLLEKEKSNNNPIIWDAGKKGAAYAYNNIGTIHANKGDYDKALVFYLKAIKIREEVAVKTPHDFQNKKSIADLYNNLGAINQLKNNEDKALELYLSALKIEEEIGYKKGMAMLYNNIGIVYNHKHNNDKALEYYTKALAIREWIGDKGGIATSYENFGYVYVDLEQYDKALEYYNKAYILEEEIADKVGLAITSLNIGDLYLKLGNVSKAKDYALKSLNIAKSIESKNEMKNAYDLLAGIDYTLKDYKSAYDYHKLYSEIKDTLFNEESTNLMTEMQTKYESEKKEKEIELQKAELDKKEVMIRQQTTQKMAFAGGFGLVLILAGVSYRSFRNKRKAHSILEIKNKIIEEKNKDITDSINYAKTIQQAILPFDHRIGEILKDYFILFKPRDIVSGDFYWFTEKDNYIFIAVADCTGHGVPGAFMSMIGSAALTHAVSEIGITDAGKILSEVNYKIKDALKQSENNNRDGMDIALLRFEKNNLNKIQFASAMRPLYILDNSLKEISGSKMGIGGTTPNDFEFVNHELSLNTGDTLYIMSDGYADQFGGMNGKKYMSGNLKKLLVSFQDKSLNDQKQILEETFESWRGNLEQVDDVCFIGIRI